MSLHNIHDRSRHSDGLTGALNHLDLSCHDGDAITTATTDDDQEGSTRSGRSRGRKSRARRPPIAHEDKRYGIYDVRRYMVAKNGTTREEQFQTTPTTQDGVVRCCCGAMADDGAMMVECEQCLVWSHVHCLQRLAATHPTFKPNLTAFVCSDCQAATNGALTAAAHWPTDASIDDALSHDDTAANTLSPFALPGADPASVSEESLVDSLASYAKHPEGKVHGGSLAMFALAASSLGAGSDDLFADLPGLDDALAMETTTGAMDSPATPWATLDNLSVPRSCPDRPVGVSRWADGAYGGALAASLAHTPCVPSTLLGRGGSPPSSMSYVSSGDVYGMTPSSSLNASSANMSSSVPSPMYSPAGKRTAHHLSGPPIVRGGVSKVVGYPSSGVHRLDTAMSTSTSTLEFMSRVRGLRKGCRRLWMGNAYCVHTTC